MGSPPPPRLVMLVMDDDDLRAMTALALEFAGFRVIATASISDAARYETTRPNIVIADLRRDDLSDALSVWKLATDLPAADTRFVWVADALSDVPATLNPACAAVAIRPVGPSTFVKIAFDLSA
jgi:CheY-like chemotaxis protein